MRADYERWWTLVSEQFDRDIPYAAGRARINANLAHGA